MKRRSIPRRHRPHSFGVLGVPEAMRKRQVLFVPPVCFDGKTAVYEIDDDVFMLLPIWAKRVATLAREMVKELSR